MGAANPVCQDSGNCRSRHLVGLRSKTSLEDYGGRCTNATLKGEYGMQIRGTERAFTTGATESVVGVQVRAFDGNGKFTQIDYVKDLVSAIVSNGPGLGNYTVSDDCSGLNESDRARPFRYLLSNAWSWWAE